MTHQERPAATDPSPSHHPLFDRRDFDCCTAGGEGRPPGFDAAHLPTVRAIADWLCGAVAEPARLSGFALMDALAALPPQQQDEAVVCGVKHPTETSWIPCMLDAGHEGEHWSTSGCAGGQVRWTQPEPAHVLVEPVAGGVIVSADLVERLRAAHEAWLETVGPKIDGRTKFAAMDARATVVRELLDAVLLGATVTAPDRFSGVWEPVEQEQEEAVPDRFSVAEIEAATEKALWGFSAHQKNRIRADLLAALRAGREGAAVGDLSQPPIVQVSDSLRALLNPCDGNAPSRGGYCGGVNGFHADDCPRAGREES